MEVGMKRFLVLISTVFIFFTLFTGNSGAFLLGEETHGVKIKVADGVDLGLRIRFQPRLDFGDIETNTAGDAFNSESDLYFRRTRLELKAHLMKNITFVLVLKADKKGKTGGSDNVKVHHVFVDYKFNDMATVRIGEKKLPYTRVAFTSSSKQLLVERPEVVENGVKKFFPYFDQMIMLYGKFADGVIKYNLALSDGWVKGDSTLKSGTTVEKSNLLYVARLVLSPPGWVEKKQNDAHLGKGRHLAFGIDYVSQKGIKYSGSSYEEDRHAWTVDLSGHYGGLTAQAEYAVWKGESTDPAVNDQKPEGWYVQAGYYLKGLDVEPAVRYEVYDHDTKKDNQEEKVTTLGVNWYLKGHSLKVQANWVHHKYDSGLVTTGKDSTRPEDTKDVYQIQGQFYF